MTRENPGVKLLGIRALEGPNLYFPRPAIRVTLDASGWYEVDTTAFAAALSQVRGRASKPGEPGSPQRARTVLRFIETVTRRVAYECGTPRLGIRVREGSGVGEVVIAFPWNRRERAKEMGRAVVALLADLLHASPSDLPRLVSAAAMRVSQVAPEPRFVMPKARVPAIAITGTNGKTTTTRLVGHIAMTAGRKTAWSSTSGVVVDGVQIESGDYSGPGGARQVLDTPGLEVAVLETARGGLLNRGMAVGAVDVSVVTNVTPDHLGEGGIDTVDQLAEVKGIITKVVKPSGWTVLNGDDPRVWAMRTTTRGRPFCFTLDPHSPAIRQAQDLHGRAITVHDGHIVVVDADGATDVVSLDEVPMTLAGLSEHNVANALAGAAGALALGLPKIAVVEGLKTFAPDAEHNPGRMNVYSLPWADGEITVVIDMAHNEAGLDALLKVGRGLVAPDARLVLGLGTGGDRTDEILTNMGEMAGLGADHVEIVHKEYYLRGRSMENLESFLREGLARTGIYPGPSWEDEFVGFDAVLAAARQGDVVAYMTHSHQAELHDWLVAHGATMDAAATIASKARAHRDAREPDAAERAVRSGVDSAIHSLSALDAAQLPGPVSEALRLLLAWQQTQRD